MLKILGISIVPHLPRIASAFQLVLFFFFSKNNHKNPQTAQISEENKKNQVNVGFHVTSHALHRLSVLSVIPAVTPHDLHFQDADITQPFVTVLIQGQQRVYRC